MELGRLFVGNVIFIIIIIIDIIVSLPPLFVVFIKSKVLDTSLTVEHVTRRWTDGGGGLLATTGGWESFGTTVMVLFQQADVWLRCTFIL